MITKHQFGLPMLCSALINMIISRYFLPTDLYLKYHQTPQLITRIARSDMLMAFDIKQTLKNTEYGISIFAPLRWIVICVNATDACAILMEGLNVMALQSQNTASGL